MDYFIVSTYEGKVIYAGPDRDDAEAVYFSDEEAGHFAELTACLDSPTPKDQP